MDNIRVALVGYGLAGKVFHAPLIAATPGLELAVVVSGAAARVHADAPGARVVATLEEALRDPDIDVVVLATPDDLHEPQALAALAAGKHVVVDKPFAVSLEGARRMARRAAECQRMVSVFHNRRWDADFLTVRRLLDAGELGDVMHFETHFDRHRPPGPQTWKTRRDGGVWQDLGPHLVDQVLQLFGMPQSISADLAIQAAGRESFDFAHALLCYDRLRVILHLSLSVPAPGFRFAVHGTRGSYVKPGLDVQEEQSKGGMKPDDPAWGIDPLPGQLSRLANGIVAPAEAVPNERGRYVAYYAAVRDAVLGRGSNPVPPEQALAVMSVLDAGLQSARERRVVRLEAGATSRP